FQRELETLRAEIKAAPAAAPVADAAATEAAAASLREAEAALAAMQEQSIAATNAATQRAALARLSVALDMGGDIESAATAAGLAPAVFAAAPSLADVQQGYPDAAREALAASIRAVADEGMASRFGAFLKSQVSPRSLSPQEGTSADAILSRAESALASGKVKAALDELAALPPEGTNALADWRAGAEAHVTARTALDDATAALPAN
ncbi:MAG: COG4223 family protein, partial [Paracoccaceae bacterium]